MKAIISPAVRQILDEGKGHELLQLALHSFSGAPQENATEQRAGEQIKRAIEAKRAKKQNNKPDPSRF